MCTPEERRAAVEQALANTRIEGHEPTAEFLADCERAIAGELTVDAMVARALRRANELETKASGSTDGRE